MSENKVSLKGFDDILKLLTAWLKTPEERKLYSARADEKIAQAAKTKSETITNFLRELAKTKSLELQPFRRPLTYSRQRVAPRKTFKRS